jgi:hypothetical protein
MIYKEIVIDVIRNQFFVDNSRLIQYFLFCIAHPLFTTSSLILEKDIPDH